MTKATLLTLTLALAAPLAAVEFKPALQLDVRGRYENQPQPVRSGWGQSANLFLIPALSFGQHSVLPVLAVLQQGRGQEREIEGSPELFFVRRNTFLAKPTYSFDGEKYVTKAWMGAKRAVNAEADDTAWSLGLYDWEEFSAGVGMTRKMDGAMKSLGLDLELQHRTYMNWHESGVQFTRFKNYYSKDYNALKASLEAKSAAGERQAWSADLTWLGKAYTDSYVVKRVPALNGGDTTDGTLNFDQLRFDQLIRLGASYSQRSSETTTLSLNVGVDWSLSNQNYFDGQFTQGVIDFYGYVNPNAALSLAWAPKGPEGLRVALRPGFGVRYYTGRFARAYSGDYFATMQQDQELSLDLDLGAPLFVKGLRVVGGAGLASVHSTTSYAAGVLSSYDLFSATLGLSYRL